MKRRHEFILGQNCEPYRIYREFFAASLIELTDELNGLSVRLDGSRKFFSGIKRERGEIIAINSVAVPATVSD